MTRYLENHWTVLDRTVIERLADFFRCDASTLIATADSTFFVALRNPAGHGNFPNDPICYYLRRRDWEAVRAGRVVAFRDNRAIEDVVTLFRNCVERMVPIEESVATPERFQERSMQNCVVVGSPAVNPASEMAICQIFAAKSFDPSHGSKIPFQFKPAAGSTPSTVVDSSGDRTQGIWIRNEEALVPADFWPFEEFRKRYIRRGRDCAVILVLNHRSSVEPALARKLIVLAGFGGIGTEGAAKALVDHYRDLEPIEDETYVWGVIEAFYQKPANTTDREFLNYNWRCRVDGRCPLDFTKRRP